MMHRRDLLTIAGTAALAGLPRVRAAASSPTGPAAAAASATGSVRPMRALPDARKFLIARETAGAPDRRGWYHHVLNVAETPDGLRAVYRRTDSHTGVISDIMTAVSRDGGRSWSGHARIAESDVWNHGGLWVAPQLTRLRDGRLVLVTDFGRRTSGQDWPMLAQWQKPPRGMSNHLFWSGDHGRTWTGPTQIDEVGGEPGYILELSNGTLVFPRTESRETDAVWNPPLPWGRNYYRNVAVFSEDGGKTWARTSILSDDPLQGDCEVGLVEVAPGRLLALTRIGFGNGQFGQPSRFLFSDDHGRTWGRPQLSPLYAQRPIVRALRSGRLLVTYRNVWGTPASYAVVLDPGEMPPYEPASFIWDESRVTLADGVLTLRTDEGRDKGAVFACYPAQAPDSRVEIEADLRVEAAERHAVALSAGIWLRFETGRVSLADRPGEEFAIDATAWHRYHVVREGGRVRVAVDGVTRLDASTSDLETRLVHFGNRQMPGWYGALNRPGESGARRLENAGVSHWRRLRVRVENRADHSIDWSWSGAGGFPDRFRRERVVLLDRNGSFSPGHSGYSGWTECTDGSIVIVDYTVGDPPEPVPFARAYVTTEAELRGA